MNKIKLFIIVSIILLCSACDGNITRDIRHDGFTYGSEFNCSDFLPNDKTGVSNKSVKYMTDSHFIDSNGKLYDISLGTSFSNKENCKESSTDIVVKAIMDGVIAKGENNKYYYLTTNNNVVQYSVVPKTDNSYYIYDLLLKADDVLKVVTGDSSNGLYYVLKDDGNVYSYIVTKTNSSSEPTITSNSIAYSGDSYGGAIVDFNYAGDSSSTYVRTRSRFYRMMVTNSDKCGKYADVNCTYEMKEDTTMEKYASRIIAYNGGNLITDYKRVFTVSQ